MLRYMHGCILILRYMHGRIEYMYHSEKLHLLARNYYFFTLQANAAQQ